MKEHEATGTIELIQPVQSGTSAAGKEWMKQSFILNTGEQYNSTYCFDVMGKEKVENLTKYHKPGDQVTVKFNVNCREYKEKYYTNLTAWNITTVQDILTLPPPPPPVGKSDPPTANETTGVNKHGLPF